MEYQPLKYIYIPSAQENAKTLLLLHGTGGDENDLIPIGLQFGEHYNILSVRGNVFEYGMPRFFKRLGMGIFDEKDLAFRTAELIHFLKEVAAKENFDVTKMIALGYSNGANIAGAILVTAPDFLAGAVLFRPMQPFKNLPAFKTTTKPGLFLSSGQFDPTVEGEATRNYLKALTDGGFQVNSYSLNAGHNLTQEDIELAKEWLVGFTGQA